MVPSQTPAKAAHRRENLLPSEADDYSMDRPREGDPRRLIRQIGWAAVAVVAIILFIVIDRVWLRPDSAVALTDVTTATVERGTLAIEVQGAGELEPVNERWIASEVAGSVERILARAGETVAAGDGIARLINPQVRQSAVAARLQLAEATAEHRRRLAEFTDRRLAGEAQILARQADLEELELQLEAETELLERQAVSEIDYRSTKIRTERARAELAFEERRFEELQSVLAAEREASEARIAERESALAEAERLAEGLLVTTDIAGTLREVLVETGQRVNAGAQVARVVDTAVLRGLIRVPESYASRVVPGQSAVVTVLSQEVPGMVTRVDPAVTQNSVAVDVAFEAELPVGVRPDLSIRATITVANLTDVLFVRRPLGVREDSPGEVFRLATDGESAGRVAVRFGAGTLRHIEVRDGLDDGDTVIVSSTAGFDDQGSLQQVKLKRR